MRRLAAALLLAAAPSYGATLLVRRGAEPPAAARDWHAALDAVYAEADALWARAAASPAAPTAADAADAAVRLSALADAFAKVTGKPADGAPARALSDKLAAAGRGTGPLSAGDAALFLDPEARSAFRLAGVLREAALEARGPAAAPNALLAEDGAAWELPFLAVDGLPAASRPTPVLAALAAAARAGGPPAEAAASSRRAWLRGPGLELLGDLGAPPGAPAVRLRADVAGPGSLEQAALYFLARALFECGFAVTNDAGTVRASFGSERGAGPEERAERVAAAWAAASWARRLPPLLKHYLSETLTRRETEAAVEGLARAFAAEGRLPLDGDGPGALSRGMAAWSAHAGTRQTLRAQMDASLAGLGLAPFPPGVPVGQRTIDLHYNEPLAAALARGELRRAGAKLERDPRWDPAAGAASAPAVPAAWKGRFGPALAWSSSVGGVSRGQWRVAPDQWLLVTFARGADGRPARLAGSFADSSGRRTPLAPERAAAELDSLGLVSLAEAPAPGVPAAGALVGVPLAPGGPVEGPVTFDASRAADGSAVFVTPYLTPNDRARARKARAIVSTAGGPLVAVVAGRAAIPAVDLPRGSWAEGAGLSVELPAAGKAAPKRALIREGDRVRVDGRRGTVELLR
ncbi:hypothetical protein EPO15_00285 [bacterium]|nr:MAG: hypothetical protein EPO15_00285 [bacterium]